MTSGASYVSRLVGQGVRVSLPTLLAWQDQRGHVPEIIACSNSAKTPIHLEHGLTCRGRGIESLLVQEQIDAKRVQLGPNKVLEAAARGAPGSVRI